MVKPSAFALAGLLLLRGATPTTTTVAAFFNNDAFLPVLYRYQVWCCDMDLPMQIPTPANISMYERRGFAGVNYNRSTLNVRNRVGAQRSRSRALHSPRQSGASRYYIREGWESHNRGGGGVPNLSQVHHAGDDSHLSPTWDQNENAPFWSGFQWNIWMDTLGAGMLESDPPSRGLIQTSLSQL